MSHLFEKYVKQSIMLNCFSKTSKCFYMYEKQVVKFANAVCACDQYLFAYFIE